MNICNTLIHTFVFSQIFLAPDLLCLLCLLCHLPVIDTGYVCRVLLKDEKTNPIKSPFPCTLWLDHDVRCKYSGSGENRWCVAAWLCLHQLPTLSTWRFFSFIGEECRWHDISSVGCRDLKEASRWRVWCWRGGDMTPYGFCVSFLPVLVYGSLWDHPPVTSNIWLTEESRRRKLFSLSFWYEWALHNRHLRKQSVVHCVTN